MNSLSNLDELGEVSRRRGVSYYHQLYTLLEMALSEGFIPPGSALPTETALMERYQISRNTVRRALAELEKEKRIVRRRGSGSYARSGPRAVLSADKIVDALQNADDGKLPTASRLVRFKKAATPEHIRRREPGFGDESLLVQRCRTFRTLPFMFTTSHVPVHLADKLTRRQLSNQTVLMALDAGGVRPATAEQTTTVAVADSVVARSLAVEVSSALLCIQMLIRDENGRPIEHQSHVFRSDRFHLRRSVAIERTAAYLQWSDTRLHRLPAWL
jgi:GntR family transcriptional regulator